MQFGKLKLTDVNFQHQQKKLLFDSNFSVLRALSLPHFSKCKYNKTALTKYSQYMRIKCCPLLFLKIRVVCDNCVIHCLGAITLSLPIAVAACYILFTLRNCISLEP